MPPLAFRQCNYDLLRQKLVDLVRELPGARDQDPQFEQHDQPEDRPYGQSLDTEVTRCRRSELESQIGRPTTDGCSVRDVFCRSIHSVDRHNPAIAGSKEEPVTRREFNPEMGVPDTRIGQTKIGVRTTDRERESGHPHPRGGFLPRYDGQLSRHRMLRFT